LPPRLLGGEIPLVIERAREGIAALAAHLGLEPARAAEGILEIAAWNQANAIQQVSVKRGLDPRDYTLVAFGGSGPLLAGRLVDLLHLRAALIPLSPGNVSAFGLLTVDLKNDYVQTFVQRHDRLDHATVNAHLARLEALARAALAAEGFAHHEIRISRGAGRRHRPAERGRRGGAPSRRARAALRLQLSQRDRLGDDGAPGPGMGQLK